MGKIVAAFVAAGVFVAGFPLMAAVFFMTTLLPAVDEQLRITSCSYSASSTMVAGAWTVPLGQRYLLRSPFGMRVHPITGVYKMHYGQDIISTESTTSPILAASSGVVRVADNVDDSDSGKHITIEHAGGIDTLYLHLSSLSVTVGQQVSTGQQIGVEGSTGLSTGAHLHFEYHQNGTPVDPVAAMQALGIGWDGTPGSTPSSPPPTSTVSNPLALTAAAGTGEGGVGFALPEPGEPRYVSLQNAPTPIPADIKAWYEKAATLTHLPWTLLAGVGMEETQHGAVMTPHPAGATGVMQFLPSTWAEEGRDGDGDGRADINNPADSIVSAAYYLVKNGATNGPDGVKAALRVYNPRDFYLNDVLYYAKAYGGGTVIGGLATCPGNGTGIGDPTLPPMTSARIQAMFDWAKARVGLPYLLGAEGPDAYDCSSYAQATFASIGISLPRTAREQRAWVAAGNGFRVQPGQEQPGDLVFTDTWLGTDTVGHVMMVYNPATHTSLEEAGKGAAFYDYTRFAGHHIYEIWRVGNVADQPAN